LFPTSSLCQSPQERVEIPAAQALDRLRELALKRQTTHFAIGDHGEAGIPLQADHPLDSCVLDHLELRAAITVQTYAKCTLMAPADRASAAQTVPSGPKIGCTGRLLGAHWASDDYA
jgi:hypothetical protein